MQEDKIPQVPWYMWIVITGILLAILSGMVGCTLHVKDNDTIDSVNSIPNSKNECEYSVKEELGWIVAPCGKYSIGDKILIIKDTTK